MKPIADLEKLLHETPTEQIPALIGELAKLQASAHLRLAVGHAPGKLDISHDETERYLTVEEVAKRYQVTVDWLYRHKRKMPHSQPSRKKLLFPERQLLKWFASRRGL